MLDRIFPKQFDNAYRGHWLAIWIFVPVMLVKAIQGVNSVVMTRRVMTTADGIPLDSFNAAGAEAAVAMFALLGFYLLILPLQSVVVMIRYRAMIPFMYLMLLIQQLGVRVLVLMRPVAGSGAAPIGLTINLVIVALTIIGFVLALLKSDSTRGNPA
jgi:hypothetical protein